MFRVWLRAVVRVSLCVERPGTTLCHRSSGVNTVCIDLFVNIIFRVDTGREKKEGISYFPELDYHCCYCKHRCVRVQRGHGFKCGRKYSIFMWDVHK